MIHRADGLVVFLLMVALSSIAIADVGYPTSRLLKLQSSEKPEMVHIRCEPIGDEKLRCNRIALSISTPTPLSDDALLERIEADIQMPGATDSLKELCPTLISELPKSKDEIREKALREATKNVEQNERLLDWTIEGLHSTRQLCETGMSTEAIFTHAKKQQELDSVACSFDWMPDYEKIYSLDKANQQWTYTLDSVGLCGRQITTENLREIHATVGRSFELEILNLYPDIDETPNCQLGLEPKPKKQVFAEKPTKYLKECLFIKVD